MKTGFTFLQANKRMCFAHLVLFCHPKTNLDTFPPSYNFNSEKYSFSKQNLQYNCLKSQYMVQTLIKDGRKVLAVKRRENVLFFVFFGEKKVLATKLVNFFPSCDLLPINFYCRQEFFRHFFKRRRRQFAKKGANFFAILHRNSSMKVSV